MLLGCPLPRADAVADRRSRNKLPDGAAPLVPCNGPMKTRRAWCALIGVLALCALVAAAGCRSRITAAAARAGTNTVETDRAGSADSGPVDNGSGQSTLDSRAALSPAARACISVALVLSVPTWMVLSRKKRRRRQVSSSEEEEDPQEEDPLIESTKYGHELHIAVRDLVKSIDPKAPLVKDVASWLSFKPRKIGPSRKRGTRLSP
jgi:hypothetical protein